LIVHRSQNSAFSAASRPALRQKFDVGLIPWVVDL
jgi:hypothetical protein